jgi:dihydrofolate reductase
MRWPTVTYVSDVASAMHAAKDAAGERGVLVHGAATAQRALTAGVLDELQIHLVPVLFGQGRRLFEDMPPDHIEFELLRVLDGPGVRSTCATAWDRRTEQMATIRLYMTTSLDGYVAGPRDSVDAPMGVGGCRLFNWLDQRNDPGPSGEVFAELMATRAVISGRRTYEHAGRWQGDHHDGVPFRFLYLIFIRLLGFPDAAQPRIVVQGRREAVGPGRDRGYGPRFPAPPPATVDRWWPGAHMNVLLAEADVSYQALTEITRSTASSRAWTLRW